MKALPQTRSDMNKSSRGTVALIYWVQGTGNGQHCDYTSTRQFLAFSGQAPGSTHSPLPTHFVSFNVFCFLLPLCHCRLLSCSSLRCPYIARNAMTCTQMSSVTFYLVVGDCFVWAGHDKFSFVEFFSLEWEQWKRRERGSIQRWQHLTSLPAEMSVAQTTWPVKESASWQALRLRFGWHGRLRVGRGRKKGKKKAEEAAMTNQRKRKARKAAERTAWGDRLKHFEEEKFCAFSHSKKAQSFCRQQRSILRRQHLANPTA